MSFRTTMAALMASQFIAADFAAAMIGAAPEASGSGMGLSSRIDASNGVAPDRWYSLSKSVSLGVLEQIGSADNYNVNGNQLFLVEGTEVSVMEISADGRYALIGIDEDGFEENNTGIDASAPTIAWVSIAELSRARLRAIDAQGIEIDGRISPNTQGQQSEFVATEVARRGGGSARRRGGRGRRGRMTYCLRDVRLGAARFTSQVPQDIEMASEAYPQYQAMGWTPVDYSPSNPVGTACFFSGGRSCGKGVKCGHAAIKISANAWKGAGVRPTPFLPNTKDKVYTLQGCLTPP